MGSDAQFRLRNFGPMPTPGIDVLKQQTALWDFAFLCWNLTRERWPGRHVDDNLTPTQRYRRLAGRIRLHILNSRGIGRIESKSDCRDRVSLYQIADRSE